MAVTNAYILCKNHTNLTVSSVKDFQIDLAKALIGEYCSCKRIGRPPAIPPAQRFCEDHFPRRGAVKPHRCYYCHHHRGKQRHETVWYCNTCQLFCATMEEIRRTVFSCITVVFTETSASNNNVNVSYLSYVSTLVMFLP